MNPALVSPDGRPFVYNGSPVVGAECAPCGCGGGGDPQDSPCCGSLTALAIPGPSPGAPDPITPDHQLLYEVEVETRLSTTYSDMPLSELPPGNAPSYNWGQSHIWSGEGVFPGGGCGPLSATLTRFGNPLGAVTITLNPGVLLLNHHQDILAINPSKNYELNGFMDVCPIVVDFQDFYSAQGPTYSVWVDTASGGPENVRAIPLGKFWAPGHYIEGLNTLSPDINESVLGRALLGCPCLNVPNLYGDTFLRNKSGEQTIDITPDTNTGLVDQIIDGPVTPGLVNFIGPDRPSYPYYTSAVQDYWPGLASGSGGRLGRVTTANRSVVRAGAGSDPFGTIVITSEIESRQLAWPIPRIMASIPTQDETVISAPPSATRVRRFTTVITARTTLEETPTGDPRRSFVRCPNYDLLVSAACGEAPEPGPCCDGSRVCSKIDNAAPILFHKELFQSSAYSVMVGTPAQPFEAVSGFVALERYGDDLNSAEFDAIIPQFVENTELGGGAPSCDPTGSPGTPLTRQLILVGEDGSGLFFLAGRETLTSVDDPLPNGQRISAQYSVVVDVFNRHRNATSVPPPQAGVPTITANARFTVDKSQPVGSRVSIDPLSSLVSTGGAGVGPGGGNDDTGWWRNQIGVGLGGSGVDDPEPCASNVYMEFSGFGSTGQLGGRSVFSVLNLDYLIGYTNLAECGSGARASAGGCAGCREEFGL